MAETIALIALFVSLATLAMHLTGDGALATLGTNRAHCVQVEKRKLGGTILWFLGLTILAIGFFIPNWPRLMAGEQGPIGWTDWLASIFAMGAIILCCVGLWNTFWIGWMLRSSDEIRRHSW